MENRYIVDYDPETKIFTMNDQEESCLIVMTKDQLQELIKLYKRCCEWNTAKDIKLK